MNVQELIDELEAIKDKTLPVQVATMDTREGDDEYMIYGSTDYVDWTGLPDKPSVVWINGYVT